MASTQVFYNDLSIAIDNITRSVHMSLFMDKIVNTIIRNTSNRKIVCSTSIMKAFISVEVVCFCTFALPGDSILSITL